MNQKIITDELKIAEAALIASEKKYKAIFNSAPLLLVTIDESLNIIDINKKVTEVLGYTPEECLGVNIFHFADQNDSKLRIRNVIKEMLETENPKSKQYKVFTKSGKQLDVSINGALAKDNENGSFLATLIIEDITEKLRMEKEKDVLLAQLLHTEKLASIGTLAASIAHEINNPLFVAYGFNEILTEQISNGDITDVALIKAANKQYTALNRIKEIVHGLKAYARNDNRQDEIVNLHKLINETKELTSLLIKKDNISIHLDLDASNSEVFANYGKLQQVLINLLTNAKDAISENPSSDRTVTIKTINSINNIVLEVKDTGTGISEEIKDKIFDPFFTTKEHGRGTGLGLSIVDSILKAMNATISFKPNIPVGSIFEITFPKVCSNQTALNTLINDKYQTIKGRALVVDDEEGVLTYIKKILTEIGVGGVYTTSALEGLDVLKSGEKFDYIITDIVMPTMSGIDFIKEVKLLGINAKIIVITGGIISSFSPDELRFIENTVRLSKPFGKRELFNMLTNS